MKACLAPSMSTGQARGLRDPPAVFKLLLNTCIPSSDLGATPRSTVSIIDVLCCPPPGEAPRSIFASNFMADPSVLLVPFLGFKRTLERISIVVSPEYVADLTSALHQANPSSQKSSAGDRGLHAFDFTVEGIRLQQFATHHTKMFIIKYDASVRVVVSTANMLVRDLTCLGQGIYWQDFPILPADIVPLEAGRHDHDAACSSTQRPAPAQSTESGNTSAEGKPPAKRARSNVSTRFGESPSSSAGWGNGEPSPKSRSRSDASESTGTLRDRINSYGEQSFGEPLRDYMRALCGAPQPWWTPRERQFHLDRMDHDSVRASAAAPLAGAWVLPLLERVDFSGASVHFVGSVANVQPTGASQHRWGGRRLAACIEKDGLSFQKGAEAEAGAGVGTGGLLEGIGSKRAWSGDSSSGESGAASTFGGMPSEEHIAVSSASTAAADAADAARIGRDPADLRSAAGVQYITQFSSFASMGRNGHRPEHVMAMLGAPRSMCDQVQRLVAETSGTSASAAGKKRPDTQLKLPIASDKRGSKFVGIGRSAGCGSSSANGAGEAKPSPPPLQLIWPTQDEMHSSFAGYETTGGSLPSRQDNVLRMQALLHRWGVATPGLGRLPGHIKTMTSTRQVSGWACEPATRCPRLVEAVQVDASGMALSASGVSSSRSPRAGQASSTSATAVVHATAADRRTTQPRGSGLELRFCLMGSHNISQSAWGSTTGKPRSFEASVLATPRSIANGIRVFARRRDAEEGSEERSLFRALACQLPQYGGKLLIQALGADRDRSNDREGEDEDDSVMAGLVEVDLDDDMNPELTAAIQRVAEAPTLGESERFVRIFPAFHSESLEAVACGAAADGCLVVSAPLPFELPAKAYSTDDEPFYSQASPEPRR